MNRTELVDAIAVKADISKKDADAAVKAFIEVVSDELQNKGKVQLVGFGTFETSERAARTGRNPQTGAATKIKACTAPKFKAGKALKDKVNTKPSKGCPTGQPLLIYLILLRIACFTLRRYVPVLLCGQRSSL